MNLIYPDINPIIFSFSVWDFEFALRWYALSYIAGILVAWKLMQFLAKRYLLWPNEVDSSFTPEPDIEKNLWFARDLASLSNHFQTEPVLIVARSVNPELDQVLPWPIDTTGIPNNHLQYAITWFSLSIIWLGMTAYWISRMKRRRE